MRTKTPDPSTVRSTVIRLRVTEAEVELFKRKAREAGCKSVSEYIRVRCIDGIGTKGIPIITYQEDNPFVKSCFEKLISSGVYQKDLYSNLSCCHQS